MQITSSSIFSSSEPYYNARTSDNKPLPPVKASNMFFDDEAAIKEASIESVALVRNVYGTSSCANELHKYVPNNDPFLTKLEGENTAWERFKTCFHGTSQLSKDIIALSAEITDLCKSTEFEDTWKSHLPNVVNSFSSPDYYRLRPHLRIIVKILNPEQVSTLLYDVIQKCAENNNMKGLHNYLGVMSLDELMLQDTLKSLMEKIEFMAKCEAEDRILADATKPTASGFSSFLKTVHGILDTVLMALNFFEIGKEPSTAWDASFLLTTYGTVISAPLAIFGLLSTFLPVLTAVIVTASIVLALILLVWVYVKFLKPTPEHIDPCVNLTSKARQGLLPNIVGRDKEIEEILNCLDSSKPKFRVHPIIVGESTVGKDTLLNGLAIRIIQGKVHHSLKGIDLQKVNARNLIDTNIYDPQNKVQRLVTRIGANKDKIVPIFNEIHEAKAIWGNLLSFLDGDSEALHRAILVTTPEGWEQMKKENRPLANRLQPIVINPTDEDNTLYILRELARQDASDLDIPEETLKYILNETTKLPNSCQPKTSVGILSKAIAEIRRKQSGYGDSDELQRIQIKYSQLLSRFRSDPSADLTSSLKNLEKEMKELKAAQAANKAPIEKLANIRKFKNQQKESRFKVAFDILNNKSLTASEIESMQKFIQFSQDDLPKVLDRLIQENVNANRKASLKDYMHIDEEMVDRLIQEKIKDYENPSMEKPNNFPDSELLSETAEKMKASSSQKPKTEPVVIYSSKHQSLLQGHSVSTNPQSL